MVGGKRRFIALISSFCVALLPVVFTGVAPAAGITPTHQDNSDGSASYNGLALTPPMGFNDWYAFNCNINERLIEQTADAIVSSGMRDAGYRYVNLDDCWMASSRDAEGNLQADPVKFPHGIRALADYLHARGLKLGIYEDVGTQTCAGYPGSYGHIQQDADTFASWGVDFVKVDWCKVPFGDFPGLTQQQVAIKLYTEYSQALQATGRPIVFSICEWDPALQPWTWAPAISNLWRTNRDFGDSWSQIIANVDQEADLAPDAGPGHWNDPDILQVGLGGMTTAEDRGHFSAWAMLAAPLLAGNDLRSMSAATKDILTNREVIAIDQDPLGAQATRLSHTANADVWVRRLANGDRAVMLLNRSSEPETISTTAKAIGLPSAGAYAVRDLWAHTTAESAGTIAASVPAHSAALYRVAPLKDEIDQYPPLTDVTITPQVPANYPGSPYHVAQPGQTITAIATLRNDGRASVTHAALTLNATNGWQVHGNPVTAPSLPSGKTLTGTWQLTVPPDADTFTGSGTYQWRDGTRSGSIDGLGGVTIPAPTLTAAFNNVGITDPATRDSADMSGNSFDAAALAAAGLSPGATITQHGLTFTWPDVPPGQPDNVVPAGQVIALPPGTTRVALLALSLNAASSGQATYLYANSAEPADVTVSFWRATVPDDDNELVAQATTYHGTAQVGTGSVFYVPVPVPKTTAQPVAIVLPSNTHMHIFAMATGSG